MDRRLQTTTKGPFTLAKFIALLSFKMTVTVTQLYLSWLLYLSLQCPRSQGKHRRCCCCLHFSVLTLPWRNVYIGKVWTKMPKTQLYFVIQICSIVFNNTMPRSQGKYRICLCYWHFDVLMLSLRFVYIGKI
jgi:hypothetical protein